MRTLTSFLLSRLVVATLTLALIATLSPGFFQEAKAVTYSISGTVYKYSAIAANVLQGASVFARNLDPSQPGSGATSAANGTFTIFGLNPGTYALEVFFTPTPGDPNAPKDLVPPALAPITITTADSTGNTIVFAQAKNTITGTVYRSNGTTPIASASVKIFSMTGGGFFSATANASGVYTQKVGAGDFMVKAEVEFGQVPDWMYPGMPKSARFDANDGTTQTVDFVTVDANVTITGTIKTPSGGVPGGGDVFAMLMAQGGFGQPLFLNPSGSFSVKVGAGTYNLMVFPSFTNPTWTAPRLSPVVVTSADANTTKNLGTITLITKTDKITGTVKDSAGTAIAGVEVMAFQTSETGVSEGQRFFMGGNFSRATTDGSGNYTLFVTPGLWSVRAMMSFGGGAATSYVPSAPQSVTVNAGTTATANLTMQKADATVNGEVVDVNGTALTSVFGFASVDSSGGEFFGLGGPLQNGKFTFKVPAGTYTLRMFLPPGAGYSAGSATTFTVATNGTVNLTGANAVKLVTNNATISGSLKDQNGNTITGKTAQVFARDDKGNFIFGTVGTNGAYSLKVAPGTWQLNFVIDPSSGYVAEIGLTLTVTSVANQTTTQNLTAKATDSTISGTTKKADGTAVAGAYVTVDSRAGIKKTGESLGFSIGNSAVSDASGNWTLKVPAGTYEVRASVPLSQGLINPKPVKVAPTASAPVTSVNLVFETSDAAITGTASTITASATTAQALAYVTAWSEKGGYTEAQTDANGKYTLNVTNDDIWHVTAIRESGQQLYKSKETLVSLGATATTASQDLNLDLLNVTLPKSASTTCSATQTCTLKLSDGATVTAPSSSLATSGNVTITATPKAQLPTQASDRPVGDYGYDFVATDGNGQAITTFNSQVSMTMPYSDAKLAAAGVTASDLVPKSWDTNNASWQAPSGSTVDTTNKTMTLSTNHFTNFAITAETSSIPTIMVSSPTSGAKVSKSTVDIVGTVSDPAATVKMKVGTKDQGSVTVNGTTGAFTKTVSLATGVNTVTIEGTNVVGTGSTSLTVENTLPTISRIGPKTLKVDKRKNKTVKLYIFGSYFVKGATVEIGPIKATKVNVPNNTTIIATLPIPKFGPGKFSVEVTNPDGGSVKADRILTIRGKAPKAKSVEPRELPARSKGLGAVLIRGENFSFGTKVFLDGKHKAVRTTVLSPTTLRAVFQLSKFKADKLYGFLIITPDGQKTTLIKALKGKK